MSERWVPATRRFFLALLTVVIGIVVPMTLKPSGVVLAVLWSLIGVALLGGLLTWEPVARRLPYRLVRAVDPHELPPGTAEADARLADECARLADDIEAWMVQQPEWDPDQFATSRMPAEYSARFDGRIFRCMEALLQRRYVTRDDLRNITTADHLGRAAQRATYMRAWSHRLRRR